MTELLSDPADRELLAQLPVAAHAANGIPDLHLVAHRTLGAAVAADALDDVLVADGLRVSPLGPGWSNDLDCHVSTLPPRELLLEAGWLPLDQLLRRLRRSGEHRWAVTDQGQVLAGVDLHVEPRPDPIDSVLRRCRQRGEVRLREVLELRALHRGGTPLPEDAVVAVAADIEHGLGQSVLARWRSGEPKSCPARLPDRGRAPMQVVRGRAGALRDALRPRLVVALSGVDGAGKSSLAAELTGALQRCGVPTDMVWTRPGMSVSAFAGMRRRLKRLLREEGSSGMQRRAEDPGARLATRTGVLGFAWSLVVTISFLVDARKRHRRARGVVIHDRHVADALVTLELVYGGTDLRLQRTMIRRLLPAADFTVFLEVAPEVAVRRKPQDFFSVESLQRQIDGYDHHLAGMARVHRLDSDLRPAPLALDVLTRILR